MSPWLADSAKACTAVQVVFKRLRIQAFMPQQIATRWIEILERVAWIHPAEERLVVPRLRPPSTAQTLQPTPDARRRAALQDSSVVLATAAERGGGCPGNRSADAQRIPCSGQASAGSGRERRVVGVEGHALARVRPTAAHARKRGLPMVQGATAPPFHFASTVSSSSRASQVTAVRLVHHHVGAGHVRQCPVVVALPRIHD